MKSVIDFTSFFIHFNVTLDYMLFPIKKNFSKKELTTEIFFDIIYSVDWEKVGGRTMEREEEKQSDR